MGASKLDSIAKKMAIQNSYVAISKKACNHYLGIMIYKIN